MHLLHTRHTHKVHLRRAKRFSIHRYSQAIGGWAANLYMFIFWSAVQIFECATTVPNGYMYIGLFTCITWKYDCFMNHRVEPLIFIIHDMSSIQKFSYFPTFPLLVSTELFTVFTYCT